MKKIFFTPGPSQLYPTVLDHVDKALKEDIASVSHRGKKFQDIFKQTVVKLHDLLDVPQEYHTIFVSSGTEAMERIIENTVEKKSIHFIQGAFSKRWYDIAKELGKNAIKHEVSFGKSFTQIPLLAQDGELICFTQNETSSGVSVDPQFIYEVGYQYPDSLIAVDIVSSAPYTKLDFTKLDCVFFSVQKLFGLPAGLGVIILSPKALEKAIYLQQKGVAIGSYHNFPTLTAFAKKNQTPETPNVLALFLLKNVIEDMKKKGIENIRKEQEEKIRLLYTFFDAHKQYKPFITNTKDRSKTVVVITVGKTLKKLQQKLHKKGFIVGEGYGAYKDTQIRIACFPTHTLDDIKSLLEVLKNE